MMVMRLSYQGNRAGDDTADRARYAVASWKDGYAKDEEMGYIFRCILNDYGYSYEVGTDGKVCFVKVMIADYDEFILIKEFFREAKAAFIKTDIKPPDDNMSN